MILYHWEEKQQKKSKNKSLISTNGEGRKRKEIKTDMLTSLRGETTR